MTLMDAIPVQQLIVRVRQVDAPIEPLPIMDGCAMYRLVDGGMPICAQHLAELGAYSPGTEARAVLTNDQIDALVVEFGLRRHDLVSLHGPQDPLLGEERCRMCDSPSVDGNACASAGCEVSLHPQWPAVYCSNACALGDL